MKKNILPILVLLIVSSCQKYTEPELEELGRGSEVYIANCISCHGMKGNGLDGAYPSLIKSQITEVTTSKTFHLIQNGSGFADGMKPIPLSQSEMKEVVNYIQNSWGNEAPFINDSQLKKHLN